VLCDANDLAHPRLLDALSTSVSAKFLTDSKVSYEPHTGTTLSDWMTSAAMIDLRDGHTQTLATLPALMVTGWSHDQTTVAYLHDNVYLEQFWLQRGGQPPVALTPPVQFTSYRASEGGELLVAFSHDDRMVLFVDAWIHRLQVFRTSDGAVVYSGSADASMAAWAHTTNRLYFRDTTGIRMWDETNGLSTFAPNLRWLSPVLSSDDRYLAYTAWDKAGIPHIEIRTLATGAVRNSPAWRGILGFLSNGGLMQAEEQLCSGDLQCIYPFTPSGKTLALDLASLTETRVSPAGWDLEDYWPR
jgi:hypothetical protein